MQAKYTGKCSLCMLKEKEVAPFLRDLALSQSHLKIDTSHSPGALHIALQSDRPVENEIEKIKQKFPTFFYGEGSIEKALHNQFILKKKTLALAESCTGGALAAKLTQIPEASKYFLGSIVAYSPAWKERFLQVSRTTLQQKGAVSREVVIEMVQGLLNETDADYGVAISGLAGPGGGTKEVPVGTIFIALGHRGHQIDAGVIYSHTDRISAIDLAVHLALGALWRRLVHNVVSFS